MSFLNNIKNMTVDALFSNRKILTKSTKKEILQALIHKLSPVTTEQGLIRLGPLGDGGYLVPNDLKGIEACFSPGVSNVSGFEKDCAELGMKVFMADKSVNHPSERHGLFDFQKKYIGAVSDEDFMTLDEWVSGVNVSKNGELLLQIDIEGYEYETFLNCSEKLMSRFRIIVAEFHCLDQLWCRSFFSIASRVFDKILQSHTCVHIHPNNYFPAFKRSGIELPVLAEFTFLRNDRVLNPSPSSVFPHPLDFENTSNPPLSLPRCWQKGDKSG